MHKDLPRSVLRRGLLEPSEDKGLPPKFHRENRQKFLKQLFADNPHLESENSVVLFKGAPTQYFFEADNNYYPHQEASFLSLFGTFEGDLYALIELKTGKTVIVPPRLDPAYKIWMVVPDPDYFKSLYDVEESIFEDELQAYLEKLEVTCVYLPYGKNEAYPKSADVATFDWLSKFKVDKSTVYPSLIQSRMYKSENELKTLQTAYDYTIEAHKNIMQAVRPGVYENQIEAIFRFEGHSRLGSKWLTAHPVVSSGSNLYKFDYYDNDRQIPDGSLVLADLGIKYNGYCADVTSTFPINGKFSSLQRDIYDLVVEGVLVAKAALKPDSDVETVHRRVVECVMEGLVKRGIITNYESAVDFFLIPHLTIIPSGHAETETGHDSRTAEKLKKNNPNATELTYMWPKLKASAVVTVSVGAYFDVNHLKTRVLAGKIDEKKFAQYGKEVGGVRIERQFVITETGAQELGSSPLTADEIEACMKGSF